MAKTIATCTMVAVLALLPMLGAAQGNTTESPSYLDPLALSGPGTGFTYQGYLTQGEEAADGDFDFAFSLHDDSDDGLQVGTTILTTLSVTNGLFSVELDFGDVLDGTPLWLEVGVRPTGQTEPPSFTRLLPRQRLTAAPYASFSSLADSMPWAGLTEVPAGFADNVDDNTTYAAGTGLVLDGSSFAITATFQLPQSCGVGQLAKWNGNAWACATDEVGTGGSGWLLTGNEGTTPGTHFVGTTDSQPLEFRVNQERALRLEPNESSPNVIAGYGGNGVGVAAGATVGGGGRDLAINQATGNYSTVDGGAGNSAAGYASSVGGGESNSASANYSLAAGGSGNLASGSHAVVGGGQSNTVMGGHSTIAGGVLNHVSGAYAAVGGGAENVVSTTYGAVGGGWHNVAAGDYATIAGGGPSDSGNPSTTHNRVYGDYGTIGGGGGNLVGEEEGDPALTVYATVGGGRDNSATEDYATVGGGSYNIAGFYAATVGGGTANTANANYATLAGGSGNVVSDTYGTVAGGRSNSVDGSYASVGGGYGNQVNGGAGTVAGGYGNAVFGTYGAIPGGSLNYVGDQYGFAAGHQARAEHVGAFVWSDSSATPFASTGPDQFLISAAGGVGIGTDSPTHMLTVGGDTAINGSASIGSSVAITVGVILSNGLQLQSPRGLYARDDLLYVTSYATNTLTIWDVSDPSTSLLVDTTTSGLQGPEDLQVVGDLAYIPSRNNDSLTVIDLSDLAGSRSSGSTNDSLTNPLGVHVSGKYAYVASSGSAEPGTIDGLAVFDVSDFHEIVATGVVTTYLAGTSDVFVSGSFAYVTSEANDRLVAFDVSDPRHIVPVAYTSQSLLAPVRVHVSGIYAYVVSRDNDLVVIFDVSDPSQVAYQGQVVTALTQPRSIYVRGDRAYVAYAGDEVTAEHCGLAVLDVSDSSNPTVLNVIDMSDWLMWIRSGTVEEPIWEQVPPKPVAVTGSGNRVYVANEQHNSVTIFEVDTLEAPVATLGELQAAHLEVTDDAAVSGDLAVRGGLNVGPGGALVQGALGVTGPGDSYIAGNLSIGPVGTEITVGLTSTDYKYFTLLHPSHKLDVDGEARFRVNDYNHLILRSANSGVDDDAYIDFAHFTYPDLITPSARIEFAAADPVTHTTGILFHTQGPEDETMHSRLQISPEGHLLPAHPSTYTLGSDLLPWLRVYSQEGVVTTSDGRYKENVAALPYGLNEVNALRPVAFSWVNGPADEIHYGLIAQQVRKVLPDVVSGGEGPDDKLGLNYDELVPVLIKAVQEQQEQINAQAEQLSALEARLTALEDGRPTGQTVLNPINALGFGGLALGVAIVAGRRRTGGRP